MLVQDAIKAFDFEAYVDSKFDRIYPTSKPYRVRTHCPMCNDVRVGHFYIHYPNRWVYCQKCKYNPKWLPQFLADMEGVTLRVAIDRLTDGALLLKEKSSVEEIVDEITDGYYSESEEQDSEFTYTPMTLDSSFIPILDKLDIPIVDSQILDAKLYLNGRGVSDFQIQKYDIRYCYQGKYLGRIVIPCYYQGDIVTFVARDMTGYSDRKYLNPTANKQGDFLFGYDFVLSDSVVVTEGVFDAISVGDMAVASFGKSLSARQLNLLSLYKTVIFYWDDDAYPQVERYAKELNGVVKTVLHPDEFDAGSRSYEDNQTLIDSAVPIRSVDYTIFSVSR